ncbi:MAG: PqqD family protein [Actinomycetota bacterium]
MPYVRPRARDDLTVVELDGEAVIYDEETTELHRLNPTATIVFGLCDGTSTMRQMSADLAEAFGVPIEEVEPQVRTLVRELRKAQLLVSSNLGVHA